MTSTDHPYMPATIHFELRKWNVNVQTVCEMSAWK